MMKRIKQKLKLKNVKGHAVICVVLFLLSAVRCHANSDT